MSGIDPVTLEVEPRSLSDQQIQQYARNMMGKIQHDQKAEFFNGWLTKLNLGDTVARLETAGKISA